MWANLSTMNTVNMNLVCLTNLPKISELRVLSNFMFNLTIIKYCIQKKKSYLDSICNETYKPTKSYFQQKYRLLGFQKYDPNVFATLLAPSLDMCKLKQLTELTVNV